MSDHITIRHAHEHNLRDVDLTLPKNSLIVFTGVSGSGKSSLAFDTLFAEGQRRYVESLSTYARQFLQQMGKPAVGHIEGLAPAIAIDQGARSHNPRSTVATVTEVYDHLRVLYAAIGRRHCPQCGREIGSQTRETIIGRVLSLPAGERVQILAPLVTGRKGEFRDLFEDFLKRGYLRARVDGQEIRLDDPPALSRYRRHDIELVLDRVTIGPDIRSRVAEAVDEACRLAEGRVIITRPEAEDLLLSTRYACAKCNLSFEEPTHADFSFNTPRGMCPACNGLGVDKQLVPELLVPDDSLSLVTGAIPAMQSLRSNWRRQWFESIGRHYGFDITTPWRDLSAEHRRLLLYGSGDEKIEFKFYNPRSNWSWRHVGVFKGLMWELEGRYRQIKARSILKHFEAAMRTRACPVCHGQRLKPESLAITVGGKSIADVAALDIATAKGFFDDLVLSDAEALIAEDALKEIRDRLSFLSYVGLHYLTLDRGAPSLSGGESQRIRLASQVGSGLVDVLYILDEPSIGLHHADQGKLLDSLLRLRDLGNTVVVVEHDEQTIRAADRVVDFGPGAGEKGGRVVAVGTPTQIARSRDSLTGRYLSGHLSIPIPAARRNGNGQRLRLVGARHNNLRDLTVELPLQRFICVTGVSGSGKSSLVTDTLYPALARELMRAEGEPGDYDRLEGLEHLDKVILIDQDPIGRTPRSNPATYTGVLTHIRDLYAQLPEAQRRGYKPGRFSFNVPEGRCSACEGHGALKLESDFMADVWVTCEVCEGRRFDRETLEVAYRGKTIAEVLDLEVGDALAHFANQPKISQILQTLVDVGLGYIRLGQPATTISGGEAQRVKLAKELARPRTGHTLYILDEPTTGLHFHDVQQLLDVLHRFVNEGNTVLVVEHHPDVIKTADHVIDMGPEGGANGGLIVAQGTPEHVAHEGLWEGSPTPTALMLREVLGRREDAPLWEGSPTPTVAVGDRSHRRRNSLLVRGAREHNLRNVEVEIPRRKLTVISGVSGSGKTSLALDTLYAEGQRRFVESLSSYARQFVDQMPKPKVDRIAGLPPAIAIDQSGRGYSPRSTVGTTTEIYDYLRVLFARCGQPHCPACGAEVGAMTISQIVDAILTEADGRQALLCAPVEPQGNEEYGTLLERLRREGWQRVRIDGEVQRLPIEAQLSRRRRHAVEVVVDRVTIGPRQRSRLAEAVEAAFRLATEIVVATGNGGLPPTPSLKGPSDGGLPPTPSLKGGGTDSPPPSGGGRGGDAVSTAQERRFSKLHSCLACGASYQPVTPRSFSFNHYDGWCKACYGLGFPWGDPEAVCPACHGARIRPEAAHVRLRGMTILDLCNLPLRECAAFFDDFRLTPRERPKAQEIIPEIRGRLRFLNEVGLDYLTLARTAPTLSGGEAQRVKLAGQLGCGLTGVMYVLDEPTVGVHPADNDRMLTALKALRDEGNTLVVVEHDPQTLAVADHIIDIGPGAGPAGGRVVAAGTPKQVARCRESVTGQFLAGKLRVEVPERRRGLPGADGVGVGDPTHTGTGVGALTDRDCGGEGWLTIVGAREHNLKRVTVSIPLGVMTCVTGPSGSGKSTLVDDVLFRAIARSYGTDGAGTPGAHEELQGLEQIDKVINIDQTPIGGTPRSNPCSYVGAFDIIREVFASLPEAKLRGFRPGRFSFNMKGGRCEVCQGMGSRCVQMHFLPDVWVTCETCNGARYNPETLAVRYRGRNIAEVLGMTIAQARELFAAIPRLARRLQVLCDVGLGYLPMGQSAPTLSGGEAQRVKLARELARPVRDHTLYLLDEPTTGLHVADVKQLLAVLSRLVDNGHSVVIIEHNLDVIKSADYVIDLGPGGGDRGGELVAAGRPEEVAACRRSATAPYLKAALGLPE
ncbi:excinuclease ABC subunit UvrA [bacterium]|nr:excinuclease ABC subunit UvrA [bacterium]